MPSVLRTIADRSSSPKTEGTLPSCVSGRSGSPQRFTDAMASSTIKPGATIICLPPNMVMASRDSNFRGSWSSSPFTVSSTCQTRPLKTDAPGPTPTSTAPWKWRHLMDSSMLKRVKKP